MKLTAFLPPLNDTLFKNAGRSKGDPIGSLQERNGVRGNNRSPQRNGPGENGGLAPRLIGFVFSFRTKMFIDRAIRNGTVVVCG
jgi:hypothetical protein